MTFVNRPLLNTDHLARTLSTLSQALCQRLAAQVQAED